MAKSVRSGKNALLIMVPKTTLRVVVSALVLLFLCAPGLRGQNEPDQGPPQGFGQGGAATAIFGPTFDTPSSARNAIRSRSSENAYSASVSSRTCVCTQSVTRPSSSARTRPSVPSGAATS